MQTTKNFMGGHIMYYLAYGSNLNLSEMKEKCPFYKVIGRIFLYNYTLSFKISLFTNAKIGKYTIYYIFINIFAANSL